MKRIKSLLAGLCTLALVVAFGVGSFGYVPAAFAAPATVVTETVAFGADKAPAKTVKYGSSFTVPAAAGFPATVTDPSGKTITDLTAKMLGNYIIKYTSTANSSLTYTFKVLSEISDEVELRVAEADIPSVVKTGKEVTLPAAKVGFYDEDGKWVDYADAAVTVTVVTEENVKTIGADNKYKFDKKGTAFVKYVATLNAGTKRIEKTYEVKVQNSVSDDSAPTISVSGVPTTASINTAVTLPVASASHETDERVKVVVTVVDPSGAAVKEADVNDDGFAAVKEGAKEVEFDNDKTMKFYPTSEGTYKVTYKAVADNDKTSREWTYNISVSDKKAPTVEIDETVIPAKWGYKSVINKADAEKGTSVTFPFPSKLVDNASAKENITVRFALKDPAGNDAARVENANSTDKNKNTVASYDGATDIAFTTESGFAFDFGKYAAKKEEASTSYQYAGTYTATYTIRDHKNNSVTRSFSIEIVENYDDDADVNVSFEDVAAQTVYANADEAVKFTVPAATVSCANDSKLSVAYTVDGKKVESGKEYEIKKDAADGKFKLYVGDETVDVTTGFSVKAAAVSDTGNQAEDTINVKVVAPETSKIYVADFANVGTFDVTETTVTASGYITVAQNNSVDSCDNVGIELGFRNADGKYLPGVSAEVYTVANKLYVRNIKAEGIAKSGKYYLEAKAFDCHGFSEVCLTEINVVLPGETGGEDFGAAALKATSAEVNASVKLNKEGMKVNIAKYVDKATDGEYEARTAFEVSGGRFSVIGDDFTALATGNYEVTAKPVLLKKTAPQNDYVVSNADNAAALNDLLASKKDNTVLAVTDSSVVKFDLATELVPYADINATVALPKGIAYTDNANAEVTVKVTDPNGSDVTVTSDSFKISKHGSYTVTYTAKIEGKEDKTFTYTVKAGDLIAPEFTVADGKDYTAKTGATFKFAKITCTEDADGKTYTYTKTLTRDGKTVASVTGRDTETSSDAIKLSESGKYTVTYTVTDENGNKASTVYSVTVTGESKDGGISLAALSAILIVVGVLLIAGVIVYLFRFRTVKKG